MTPIARYIGRAILPLLLLVLAAPRVDARQASVHGFVTEAATEQSLQGASIVLQNDDGAFFGTITDGDGYFILSRIPAGSYTFRVSFVGFAPFEESLTLTAGQSLQRTVGLEEQDAELDEVVVEAELEAGVTAVTAGLESIVPAQIERVPMPGVTGDLASYLQTVPGIAVQGDRGGQFFVRGGALDQNLAMLDGIPIYMPFHILSFYSAFPEEIINEASVYTGGFGAKYGTRISSMMDVSARNGNKQYVAGSASASPFLSTARIEAPLWKDRVSFIGSVRHSLVRELMPNILSQALPYSFGDQFGKLHAFINPNHSVSFTAINTFDWGDIAGTQKTFEGDLIADAPTDSTEIAWDNTAFGGRYTFTSSTLPLRVDLSGNQSEMINEMGPENARERTSRIKSFDIAADLTWFLNRGQIRLGGLRRASTLGYELGGQFEGLPQVAENDLTEITTYLEGEYTTFDGSFNIQPGVQLYALPDRSQQWVDPRLRVTFFPGGPDSKHQINAAVGRYHQAIVGLNNARDIGNLFTAWVPALEENDAPESQHAILGWNAELGNGISVAAEGFYKTYSNLSVPIFSSLPSFTTRMQLADGEAYGGDFRLDFEPRDFWYGSSIDGYVSYTFSKVNYETEQFDYNPSHDRRHQINTLFHAEWREVGFTLQYQFGTGMPFTESGGFDIWLLLTPETDVSTDPGIERVIYNEPFRGRQPEYHRLDAWLERRIDRGRTVVTLRAGGLNILNRNNLFYYDLFTFRRVDQLPFVPSVGFKVELR